MENSLTKSEFNNILSSNMEMSYQKLNFKVFNLCVNDFNDVRLSQAEIDCIKAGTSLFHDTLENSTNYFYRKLKKE